MGLCRLSAKKVVCRQALKNLYVGSRFLSVCRSNTTFKSSTPLPRRCQPGFLISICAHGFFNIFVWFQANAGYRCWSVMPLARSSATMYNQSVAALPQRPSVARLSSPVANEGWTFPRGKDSPRVKVASKRDAAQYRFLVSVCNKAKVAA